MLLLRFVGGCIKLTLLPGPDELLRQVTSLMALSNHVASLTSAMVFLDEPELRTLLPKTPPLQIFVVSGIGSPL